jgi:hypothetical protein
MKDNNNNNTDFPLNLNKNITNSRVLLECKTKGPNNKLLKEYKKRLFLLSSIQREASIGLMLGDASLQTQNGGKTHRMKFEWGDKNKIYAEHVLSLFDEWVLSPMHKKTRINVNNNTVVTWGFQTISHNAFNYLKSLFLINNHKGVVDNLVKDHLTEIGLAYWFMDDGGKLDYNKNSNNKSIVLNTHNFTLEEVNVMANQISSKFNLDTYVKLNKKKYIIVIKSNSFGNFIKLTHNYIISEMRYKLP